MNVGKVSNQVASTATYDQPKPIPSNSSQSSIASLEIPFTKEPSRLQIFFEDVLGFLRNIICWPVHGTMIFQQQILLLVFFPVIFPLLIIEIFVKMIATFCSICTGKSLKELFGPNFFPREPTAAEAEVLKPLVQPDAAISEKQQLELLHLLNTYFEFSRNYARNIYGKENTYFNSLIKVDIDGVPQLFQYSSSQGKPFESFIKHIAKHAKESSSIRFTFVGLDYSYFIGMLKMKVSTDVVKYQVKDEKLELQLNESGENKSVMTSFKSLFLNFFYKWVITKNHQPYDHVHELDQRALDFSLWPGNTRRLCADLINSSLSGTHLSEYHISLIDLHTIVKP